MIALLTTTIGLAITVTIFVLIRKDRLHTANGLGWLFVAICFAFLGAAPSVFDQLAAFWGIKYPPTLALSLAVAIIVVKLLLNDIHYSSLRVRHQRLVQRMALLESQLRKARDNPKDSEEISGTHQKEDSSIKKVS